MLFQFFHSQTLRSELQVRREAEVKLHPLQQKEADLMEELSRQKEKERLRKVRSCTSIRLADAATLTRLWFRRGRNTSRCASSQRTPTARCPCARVLTTPRAQELKKRHEDEKTRLEQLFLKEQAGRRDDQVPPTLRAGWPGPASESACAVTRRGAAGVPCDGGGGAEQGADGARAPPRLRPGPLPGPPPGPAPRRCRASAPFSTPWVGGWGGGRVA